MWHQDWGWQCKNVKQGWSYILTKKKTNSNLRSNIWLTECKSLQSAQANFDLTALWGHNIVLCVESKSASIKNLLSLLCCPWEDWVEQYLPSLIKMWPLLFTCVLWLYCLQPLKDFGRQERGRLPASIWHNSAVTRLCGTSFSTPCVNRRIRWRDCDSWGKNRNERFVK